MNAPLSRPGAALRVRMKEHLAAPPTRHVRSRRSPARHPVNNRSRRVLSDREEQRGERPPHRVGRQARPARVALVLISFSFAISTRRVDQPRVDVRFPHGPPSNVANTLAFRHAPGRFRPAQEGLYVRLRHPTRSISRRATHDWSSRIAIVSRRRGIALAGRRSRAARPSPATPASTAKPHSTGSVS
jgi:hypothetical protein